MHRARVSVLLFISAWCEIKVILNEDRDAIPEDQGPGAANKYQDLLNWAVTNSDPDRLAKAAEEHDGETVLEKLGKDVYDAMFAEPEPETGDPEDNVNLLEIIGTPKTSDDDMVKALEMLEEMVTEPDLANGLYQSGALGSIADQIFNARPTEVKLNAAWVLGTACQNNDDVQLDLLSLDMCRRVMDQFKVQEPDGCGFTPGQTAGDFAVCSKLLYFTSAFVRNSKLVQIEASDRGLFTALLDMFSNHIDRKVVRKTAMLLETVAAQDPSLDFVGSCWNKTFFDTCVRRVNEALTAPFDVDTAERIFELVGTIQRVRKRDERERDSLLNDLSTVYEAGLERCQKSGEEHKFACERLQYAWDRLLESFTDIISTKQQPLVIEGEREVQEKPPAELQAPESSENKSEL